PNAVWAYSGAAGARRARTRLQSHSSSSATSMGSEVITPCPNSRCFTITVQVPSLPMWRNAFGATGFAAGAWASAWRPRPMGRKKAIARPPESAAEPLRKTRRERFAMSGLLQRGARAADRLAHPLVGAAAAEVAAHRGVDVGVARRGVLLQQGGRRHPLARLAVAALDDVLLDPRRLHRA